MSHISTHTTRGKEQEAKRIRRQNGSGGKEDQEAKRIRRQRGSGGKEDQEAKRIKRQRGSGGKEDQEAKRIRRQRGSGGKVDQEAKRIRRQRGSGGKEDHAGGKEGGCDKKDHIGNKFTNNGVQFISGKAKFPAYGPPLITCRIGRLKYIAMITFIQGSFDGI
ncbi:hypothetical protein EMCRGX_G000654 [Ephydatia muelleri]